MERENLRKLLCRLFLVSLLIFSTISHTAMSLTILNVKSVNSLDPIHNEDLTTNGIVCNLEIGGMYFNNDFLFLEKPTDYHEFALEIYDVSIPQEMELVKTYEFNRSYCYYVCLTGNVNYTFIQVEEPNLERAVVAIDVNSPELAQMKAILPESNYTINQIVADNEHLYLVRDPYNWTLDWQVEKYKINNPFSLSLVSNTSVSKYSRLYVKDNNSFIINGKNINNWTIPYGSDNSRINDVYYEDNRLIVLMYDNFLYENYSVGLLVIDVTNNESYQVLANNSLNYGHSKLVNFNVFENNIFIAYRREIIVLEILANYNFEEISRYSFEYIWGSLEEVCYGSDLLFISKESCSGRDFGVKDEDKVSLVILDVENPRKIEAVFPKGFDNRFNLFLDGSIFNTFLVGAAVVVGISLVPIFIVFIIKRRKRKEKNIEYLESHINSK